MGIEFLCNRNREKHKKLQPLATLCPYCQEHREFNFASSELLSGGLGKITRYECSECKNVYDGFYLIAWRGKYEREEK